MVTTMKVNGKTIRQMAMEYSCILKPEQDMKGIGKTICNMDQVCRFIVMAINTKECLSKGGEMVKELTRIQLVKFILEDGLMVVSRDLVSAYGWMEKSTRGNGKITKNMGLVFLPGLMEDLMKETIETIKNMVMGPMFGQMEGNILDNGRMIRGMEGEPM